MTQPINDYLFTLCPVLVRSKWRGGVWGLESLSGGQTFLTEVIFLPNQTNICSLATRYPLTRSSSDIVWSILTLSPPRSLMLFYFCFLSFSYFSFLSLIPAILLCLLEAVMSSVSHSYYLLFTYLARLLSYITSYLHLLFSFCFFPLLYPIFFYLFDFFVLTKIRLYFQTTVNTYLSL